MAFFGILWNTWMATWQKKAQDSPMYRTTTGKGAFSLTAFQNTLSFLINSVFWKAVNEKAHFPVVVLYTGESCAFCQVASHVFQTLKGLISSELVEFVSVDASANDLPWAFTALAVPSVLYFHPSSSTSSKPKAATHTTASSAATFSIWILLGTLELNLLSIP